MHELAVCQALLSEVCDVVDAQGPATVSRITVCVGPLSGVEPALLERAFYLARAGGPAAEAELVLESGDIRVRCRACGTDSKATPARLVCGCCGDFHVDLLSGDELLLRRVELIRGISPEDNGAGVGKVCHV